MDQSLIQKIQMLDHDLQQKILSYTYSCQPRHLLDDIRDYITSLENTKEYYFSKYMVEPEDFYYKTDLVWLLDDINEYISTNIFQLNNYEFWRRSYMLRNSTEDDINYYVTFTFYKKEIEIQINFLWGLLTPSERADIIYYGIEFSDTESENEEQEDDYDY